MEIKKASELQRGTNFSALIYAPPGTGKTTTIKYLPGRTLVIDVDRTTIVLAGEDNIDIVYADLNDTEVGFKKMLKEIHDEHIKDYDNIVIDNISELEQAWLGEKAKLSRTKDGRAMGIPEMVKNLFSSSKVAEQPPRRAQTTLAPTFMVLSKRVL